MHIERQAHGMVLLHNFVYCCGGHNSDILNSCERYNLETEQWQIDVPDLKEAKFSMTMIAIDN